MGMSPTYSWIKAKVGLEIAAGSTPSSFGDGSDQPGLAGAQGAGQRDDDPGPGELGDRAAEPRGVIFGGKIDRQAFGQALQMHRFASPKNSGLKLFADPLVMTVPLGNGQNRVAGSVVSSRERTGARVRAPR